MPTIEKKGDTFSLKVYRDDDIGVFGAYLSPSIKRDEHGVVLVNVDFHYRSDFGDATTKEVLIETMMHEFGHALEELLDMPFEEERIDAITDKFNSK